jgi:hypothetical protein
MKKKELFWVNLTEQLRATEKSPGWVQVANTSRLSADTVHEFYTDVATYAGDARMRIRAASEEEALNEAVRARRGLDPLTAPNPLYDDLADLFLRHEERIRSARRSILRSIPLMTIVTLMLIMWPRHIRFVEGSADINPYPWVINLYSFMFMMALTIFFEFRAGRLPIETGKWLWMIAGNFFWIPVMDPDGDSGWWGDVWIWAGILVPSFGIKLLVITFIKFAVDRKRNQLRPAN